MLLRDSSTILEACSQSRKHDPIGKIAVEKHSLSKHSQRSQNTQLGKIVTEKLSGFSFVDYLLKLERYGKAQHGPCAKTTHGNREVAIEK